MVKGWGRPTPAQLETHPSLCLSAIYVMTRQCLSKLNIALAIPQIPCLGREPCEWDIRKCAIYAS